VKNADFTPNFSFKGRVEKVEAAMEILNGVSTPLTVGNNSSTNKGYST
jgi:hypothetical protein